MNSEIAAKLLARSIYGISSDDTSEEALWKRYYLEIAYINISKAFQVFLCALLFHTLLVTLIAQFSFGILRRKAFGWHAPSSLFCSLYCLVSFVGLPYLFLHHLMLSGNVMIVFSLLFLLIIWLLAPMDTINNPINSSVERLIYKKESIKVAASLIVIGIFIPSYLFKISIFSGILSEVLSLIIEFRRKKDE